jgi:pimeloyl-ACP methyl ester carboxylesterase
MRSLLFVTMFVFQFVNVGARSITITEDVMFINKGDTLSGTLVLPDTSSLCPALVMIHGSGVAKRNIGYAKKLAAKGVAVLTYDKRGCGKSGGKYNGNTNVSTSNLKLLAGDALAGVELLTHHNRIDHSKIGLWGISQAGWIAPIAASESGKIAFIVMLSGPTVPVVKELKYSAKAENDPDFFNKYTQDEIEALMNEWTFSGIYFWIVGFRLDPKPLWEKLDIPVLWIYGEKDRSIPAQSSISIIEQMNKTNFHVKTCPDYGHLLKPPESNDVPADEVNDYFIRWIMQQIGE